MWLLILSLLTPASALTTDRQGVGLDLTAGGSASLPGAPAGTVELGLHWWSGPYDDSYALGRYWALGTTDRLEIGESIRLAPTLEVRRGVDLIVVGWYGGLNAGPLLTFESDAPLGATVRAVGGFEFRRTRTLGLTARLEAGADVIGDTVAASAALTVGVQFSAPADGRGLK